MGRSGSLTTARLFVTMRFAPLVGTYLLHIVRSFLTCTTIFLFVLHVRFPNLLRWGDSCVIPIHYFRVIWELKTRCTLFLLVSVLMFRAYLSETFLPRDLSTPVGSLPVLGLPEVLAQPL